MHKDYKSHPSYAVIGAARVSSTPGVALFDSDIRHSRYVELTISTAERARDLNRDWIHEDTELIKVAMSEAQWASFVSSMNTSGVPCTLRRLDDVTIDQPAFEPRLRQSMKETHDAAERAFAAIKVARDAYEAHKIAANLSTLHHVIENATANVDYAGKTLAEHAENVVQKARADLEAMVLNKVQQLGLEGAAADDIRLELES